MKIWLRLICILAGVAVLAVSALPSLAATPHEDPAQAKPVYNAFLLFEYYTEALDLVLAKEAVDVAGRMEKMPFANLPDSLSGATASFSLSTGILA